MVLNGVQQPEENGNEKASYQNNQELLSQVLYNSSTASFHELYALGPKGSIPVRRTHKCCVYIASNSKYCMRLDSIQAFSDINRDVSLCLEVLLWACFNENYLFYLSAYGCSICGCYFFSQVIGDASHLSGYSFSAHNNIIHPSAELGSKTTVSLAFHSPKLIIPNSIKSDLCSHRLSDFHVMSISITDLLVDF